MKNCPLSLKESALKNGGGRMNENFMKEKPVLPLILSMALPMVLSMLVNSLYNIVDSFFVAQISEDAMTALSLVFPIQNFINAVAIGFGVGMNAVIAFHLGAGNHQKADMAATQGLLLAVIHGVVMTIGCIAFMPAFLRMFTSSESVIELGVRYSVVAFSFTPMIVLGITFEKIFQAVGNMKVTMVSLMCGCIANIALDPLLIFGIGPFPKMGMEGAALATGIGQTLTLGIYLVVYFVRPIRVHIRKKYVSPNKDMVLKLYSVGIPATLNLALPSFLISSLNAILAAYSEVYILVLGIYYKLQTFLYLPANGIVQGMRPLIGYNYGAGNYERLHEAIRISVVWSTLFCAAFGLTMAVFSGPVISRFTKNDMEMIRIGQKALKANGLSFLLFGFYTVYSSLFLALGKAGEGFVLGACRQGICFVPIILVFPALWGLNGILYAQPAADVLSAMTALFMAVHLNRDIGKKGKGDFGMNSGIRR